MATAANLTEDYLTCTICYDVFTSPAILDCDHTFCRHCLIEYIKTEPDAIKSNSIPCAICRQLTKVTSPDKPVEEWANQVKSSRLIQGLIDDFAKAKEGDSAMKTNQHTFLCRTHEDEEIKLFCKDCKKAICHLCCGIDHRHCKKIISIKEALPEITSSILSTKKKLDEMMTKQKNIIANRNANLKHITTETTKVASDIQTVCRMAVGIIDAKEQTLLNKLNQVKLAHTQELEAELMSDEIVLIEYQRQSDSLDHAVKSHSPRDLCILFEKDDKGSLEDENDQVPPPDKIKFKWDSGHLSTVFEDIQLGNVYRIKAGDIGRESSPVLHQIFDTSSPFDKSTPDIQNVVVMEVEDVKLLVGIDKKNKNIKSRMISS